MKKEVIAVDIDNVLAQHAKALMSFYNSVAGTALTELDYTEDWLFVGEKMEDIKSMGSQFVASGVHAKMEVIPGALEALKYLKQKYQLVIVTARNKAVNDMTLDWVGMHFPDIFDDICFAKIWEEEGQKITKATLCSQAGASFLIDDSLVQCELVAKAGIQSILFGNYPWNKHEGELPKKMKRCSDWPEVLEYLNRLKLKETTKDV